jgi:hypothetical protein
MPHSAIPRARCAVAYYREGKKVSGFHKRFIALASQRLETDQVAYVLFILLFASSLDVDLYTDTVSVVVYQRNYFKWLL